MVKSWKNSGLKQSEHISKIIVHPNDPNTVWVAVQGPLWSPGGERGLYKSTDGGKTWKNTLAINEWTGVTDLVIDATNPDVLYAASWQRQKCSSLYGRWSWRLHYIKVQTVVTIGLKLIMAYQSLIWVKLV